MRFFIILYLSLLVGVSAQGQQNSHCSNNAARSWWDVQHYDINLQVDTANGFLSGYVNITANVTSTIGDSLQIDLQEPLKVITISTFGLDGDKKQLQWVKNGNAYYVIGDLKSIIHNNTINLNIQYEGIPQIATRPPWDGGIVLDRDTNGTRWMAVACQGIGASVWFPCKDYQGDEADKGMQLTMTVPAGLTMVGNGKCTIENKNSTPGKAYWTWAVSNPINNYDISFYIGDYVHWSDTLNGVKGKLSLDYWVLRQNLSLAKKQFEVVKPMLHCFEDKMGPYPFYEDGYKLVDAPYLGMEHQSAVAYGNKYKMGYLGRDRSNTGVGLKFDFIIIHESGHEWFGNSITTYDKADTWIHEGFTTYTETIFAECLLGKEQAFKYQQGKRPIIHNDRPVQGKYNECDGGSGDHYDKAAFMIHTIRLIMNDDAKFFGMLKEMNKKFYHKIIAGKEMEQFINEYSGKDFNKVFDQYLRTKDLPVLEMVQKKGELSYRWVNCVPEFDMSVIVLADGKKVWLHPKTEWGSTKGKKYKKVTLSEDFLVDTKTE
jgi:aminopeptidase N